jgi:hypothetical protein
VRLDGALIEDTVDWYAQDQQGNVWYFGEDTKEYEHGRAVSDHGSWEAGFKGAQPGIVMEASPQVGDRYRQEYFEGEAEDMAKVIAVDATATVPAGSYTDVVKTKDFTPLEPKLREHKYYARGVGVVLEVTFRGGSERAELVEHARPDDTAPPRALARPVGRSTRGAEGRGMFAPALRLAGRTGDRFGRSRQVPGMSISPPPGRVMSGITSLMHLVARYVANFAVALP